MLTVIDGQNCKSEAEFFSELSQKLEFPPYFGRNWDAVDECITDLEWLSGNGYVIVVDHSEDLFVHDEIAYNIFIRAMKWAGEQWGTPQTGQWARPAVPFHVVLAVEEDKMTNRKDWGVPKSSCQLDSNVED